MSDNQYAVMMQEHWPPAPAEQYVSVGKCASSGVDIKICYNEFGNPRDPPVLLIMGLGCQGPYWDSRMCSMIADAGFHVIRFDNRDVGLSTHLDVLPNPGVLRRLVPSPCKWLSDLYPTYTLEDMTIDAVRLLDALELHSAHIVGCSMGGMIAQIMAVKYPRKVRSLCLLSTSSQLPFPSLGIIRNTLRRPKGSTLKDMVDFKESYFRYVSGDLPFPSEEFRAGMFWSCERCMDERGRWRHLAATVFAKSRISQLGNINASIRPAKPTGLGFWVLLRGVTATVTRALLRRMTTTKHAEREDEDGGSGVECRENEEGVHISIPKKPVGESLLPVVVLHGGSDPFIRVCYAEELASSIAGAKLVVFPKMGHYFPSSMFCPVVEEIVLNARNGEASRCTG